jgi:hypothetical protein
MDSVVAVDLNLNNEWFQNTITKYFETQNYEKWFLSTKSSNLIAIKSTETIYLDPVQTSDFVIDEIGSG